MDRFLIAPFRSGLQTDLRPFLIPEDAFQQMNNAYVFRGRVRKRFGSILTGAIPDINHARVRIDTGEMTDGSGNFGPALPTNLTDTITAAAGIGAYFLIGGIPYTVYQATGALLTTPITGGSGTFNTATGSLQIVGGPIDSEIYYYPGLPIMGLGIYEDGPVNNQPAIAFDTISPYEYDGTQWSYLMGTTTTPSFSGTNNDYFWTTTYRGSTADIPILFVSNNVDPMWYYNGTGTTDWTQFNPVFDTAGDTIYTARIILSYQNRLVLLNTIETVSASNITYVNRARWSSIGNPLATNAWLIPKQSYMGSNPIGGGFEDAATEESIVGAEFIKDRLIVYFEASTWELAYTGNQVQPFKWQKINTELGAVGTFSTIPFDKAVLGIGKTGVHACSGASVQRIDQKIPDDIFDFKVKDNAYNRINGIRVYQPELAVWSYVSDNTPPFAAYANKQIIYNYENETWSFNDDCVMCYGFFEQQSDLIWENAEIDWEDAGFAWNANVVPAEQRQVIFGNQQGTISILQPDIYQNSAAMLVNKVTNTGNVWTFKVRGHNLAINDFIYFETNDYLIFSNDGIFEVFAVVDADTFLIYTDPENDISFVDSGVGYQGGLTIARVSQVNIISKQWNPYLGKGMGIYLAKIVFAIATTDAASIQVDYASDDSTENFVGDSETNGTDSIIGSSTLEMFPYEGFDTTNSNRLWHPVYFQGQGNCVQVNIYYNEQQMLDSDSSLDNFEMQAIMLFTMPGIIRFA